MSETCETIMQEYLRALDAIEENRARQVHVRPRVQPVPWHGEAVQIDTGDEALRLRHEQTRLAGLLEQLEDTYLSLGGNLDDLHRLAARGYRLAGSGVRSPGAPAGKNRVPPRPDC